MANKAQKMVPAPKGLDLNKVINPESEKISKDDDYNFIDESFYFWRTKNINSTKSKLHKELSKAELDEQRRIREQYKKNNPFYLGDTSKKNDLFLNTEEIDEIPIISLETENGK